MNTDCTKLLKNSCGFSLIELIIVIGLIVIASGIATFGFNDWQKRGWVESQIKQMASDINEVRIRALTTKQRHSLTLNENSYVFKSYSSESEPVSSGTVITGGTHTVLYPMRDATSRYAGERYMIDERGMLESFTATVFLDDVAASHGSINCLTIHTIRVNVGKQRGTGVCDDK